MEPIPNVDRDDNYAFATYLPDLQRAPGACLCIQVQKHTIALFYHNSKVYAVDNRCPHMGFPLNQGTVKDCILTCHWHHARFDLNSGGTFDQWAGDVHSFPVKIRNENEVWVDITSSYASDVNYYQALLQNGLRQNLQLLIAKAVIAMSEEDQHRSYDNNAGLMKAFYMGLDFGTQCKESGWGQGLTTLICMMNIMPYLDTEDKPYCLYHGLCAVAQDCASMPARFEVSSLPEPLPDLATIKRWFRQFVESRDSQAAERCIATAVRLGATNQQIADILFTAATEHRFLDGGHILDFTNKALEALDKVDWEDDKELIESVLTSLVPRYVAAARMEESSSWRYPVDLVGILDGGFKEIATALEKGKNAREERKQAVLRETKGSDNDNDNKMRRKQVLSENYFCDRDELTPVLLGDNPQKIVNTLLDALSRGAGEEELASIVCYASALRVARFHTRNEFGDWDATLHTFTFANAVHQGLRRMPSPELLRGLFDAGMRIYLNRFLNVPATITKPRARIMEESSILKELSDLFDRQQQVNEAGQIVVDYLHDGGTPDQLISTLGKLLLREDRNFHSIQMLEAAFRQYSQQVNNSDDDINNSGMVNILLAVSRYLAAHSPTIRSQNRTYQIANQLHHGEQLFEERTT